MCLIRKIRHIGQILAQVRIMSYWSKIEDKIKLSTIYVLTVFDKK